MFTNKYQFDNLDTVEYLKEGNELWGIGYSNRNFPIYYLNVVNVTIMLKLLNIMTFFSLDNLLRTLIFS